MRKVIQITQEFTFLDQAFAECFRAFEFAFNIDTVREKLVQIRASLAKRQQRSSDPKNSNAVYIGNLGEFCENVCTSWKQANSTRKMEGYRSGLKYGDDCIFYLQDALEIPYWQLVIDLFLDWRESNTNNMLATAILHMLRNKAISCRRKTEELRRVASLDTDDQEGLFVLLQSIKKRLGFLEKSLEMAMPSNEGLETTGYLAHSVDVIKVASKSATRPLLPLTSNVRHTLSLCTREETRLIG